MKLFSLKIDGIFFLSGIRKGGGSLSSASSASSLPSHTDEKASHSTRQITAKAQEIECTYTLCTAAGLFGAFFSSRSGRVGEVQVRFVRGQSKGMRDLFFFVSRAEKLMFHLFKRLMTQSL